MTLRGKTKTFALILLILVLTGAMFMASFPRNAYAAQLTARKLTLSSSTLSASATWTFQFSAPGTTALNGIAVQICTTATGSCTAPGTGGNWTNSGSAFGSLTYNGSNQAGWTLDNAAGYLRAKNNSSSTATANVIVLTFNTVTNPDVANQTFYGRITTYTGDDFTGSLDTGVVAASTATAIVLTGYMPESLVFCTGATVSTTGGLPDCATATAGGISLPDFSPTATSFATSQMAASTNAGSGYSITVYGPTLTSGGNTIDDIGGTAELSQIGKIGGQFGLNLKDNATPNTGTEVAPAANGTNYKGQAKSPFATVDNFAFTASTTQEVAASDNGGLGPTDAQIFTVAYIVNVSGAQPVGTYTTTLLYICTPTF